jgi:hypothetical protein
MILENKTTVFRRGISAFKINQSTISLHDSTLTVDEKSIDFKTVSKVKLDISYTRYEGALWIYTFLAVFANGTQEIKIEFNDIPKKMSFETCSEVWAELIDAFWKHIGFKSLENIRAELLKTGSIIVDNKFKFTKVGIEKNKRTLFGKKMVLYPYESITTEPYNYTSILKADGKRIGQLFFGLDWNTIIYNHLLTEILQKEIKLQ